jgi:histidyl-tRNA synthetase
MRDVSGEELERAEALANSVSDVLSASGYAPLETPVVEQIELFVRKSGGEVSGSLYSFIDPGGLKVSLRPEFTSSVIRHYIESPEARVGPSRWRYAGPVFRYDYGDGGSYRQFTQVGAELVGDSGPGADAEVLRLVLECLTRAGVGDAWFTIGHLGLIHEVLSWFGLSEPVRLFVVGNLGRLAERGEDAVGLLTRARESGLVFGDPSRPPAENDDGPLDREVLLGLFDDSSATLLGRRTPEAIVDRLLRKVRDATNPESFQAAVEVASKLGGLKGDPRDVVEAANTVLVEAGVDSQVIVELKRTLSTLAAAEFPFDRTKLDFSFARGIAYYTGLVFEVHVDGPEGQITVGGGGRYDDLVKALGGQEDVPALGFAFTMERLLAASGFETGAAAVRNSEG